MSVGVARRLYRYYQASMVLPTYTRLQTAEDLQQHAQQRARLYRDRLHLPPRLFRDARVLEFGPDAGENALVLACWGAQLTLVEPNEKAWPRIAEYFERFALQALEKMALEAFESPEQFDVIVAEGFIYTVRPKALWIDRFARLIKPEGLVSLFYYEAYGALMELTLKLIHARAKKLLGQEPVAAARAVFEAKWDSIPHTRAFESWVMDVLENPFVRLRYFFQAEALCAQLAQAGFSLYSSWPTYRQALDVTWPKQAVSPARQQRLNADFIARSRLSFALGQQLFVCASSPAQVQAVSEALWQLLTWVDGLLEDFDAGTLGRCARQLGTLRAMVGSEAVLAETSAEKDRSLELLDSLERIFQDLAADRIERVIAHCNADAAFIRSWGLPGHYVVFQKDAT